MGGNRDTAGTKSMPIDQYRKQIGKQDTKKARRELKEIKQKSEAKKSAMGITDVMLMVGAFLAVLIAVYGFLYLYLQKDSSSSNR